MRSRFSLGFIGWLAILAGFSATPRASAQALDIFVTPIPNTPFSAVINVERTRVQPDGSIVALKTTRQIGRDNKGRIFNQGATLLAPDDASAPQVLRVHIYDPETRVSTMLFPRQRMYTSLVVNHPPETQPPSLLSAAPGGKPLNEFTRQEDLGSRQIEGLSVHGVRETQTIPAENNPTGKEIVVIDELWYSPDLRINMQIKHNDPRTGSVTMTVSQVSRWEPDPFLFQIPEGFTPPPVPTGAGGAQPREREKQQP